MAQAAKEALGVSELGALADAGYHSDQAVATCVENKITPTVPASQTGKAKDARFFTKADFTYVPERDVYRCPGDQELRLSFVSQDERFYANAAACAACPLRTQCINTTSLTQGRRIKRTPHEHLLEAMAERLRKTPELLVQRKSLAEHPFGTLKRWDDAGYFLVRGLEKVRAEFSLMTLTYNLRRAITILGVPTLLRELTSPGGASPCSYRSSIAYTPPIPIVPPTTLHRSASASASQQTARRQVSGTVRILLSHSLAQRGTPTTNPPIGALARGKWLRSLAYGSG